MEPAKLPKLPPSINTTKLIKQLGQTYYQLGQLNRALLEIKTDPFFIMAPLITKEALASTRIEGTQATISDIYHYEASNKFKVDKNDIIEVIRYRKALLYGWRQIRKYDAPLTENFVKKLHRKLLLKTRGQQKNPGNFREQIVHIGKPGSTIEEATYVPPIPTEIPKLFYNWENYIEKNNSDPLLKIGIAHYQFEAIHPFSDGNGRLGRLLITLQLCKENIIDFPLLYLSGYLEKHRTLYTELLNEVSCSGKWEEWLLFFLKVTENQSIKTLLKIFEVRSLYEKYRDIIIEFRSPYSTQFLDTIFKSPICNYTIIKASIKAKSNQTIFNLIDKFVSTGILKYYEKKRKRDNLYFCKDLLRLINKHN